MKRRHTMNNIFYIITVVVVVAVILGYFGVALSTDNHP